MKTVTEYLNEHSLTEGILDIEDNLDKANIELFKEEFKLSSFDVQYIAGTLKITSKLMGMVKILLNDIPWKKFFKDLQTIVFSGRISIRGKISPETLCENIIITKGIFIFEYSDIVNMNVKADAGVWFKFNNVKLVENCNIELDGSNDMLKTLHTDNLPEFKNVISNIKRITIYSPFAFDDAFLNNFSDKFNNILDTSYTIKIKDKNKGILDFKPKNIKQIVAKVNNPKRYTYIDNTTIGGEEIFKFKENADIKKEFGLNGFKSLKRINVSNNNVGFEIIFDYKDQKTHQQRIYAGFYKK